MTDFKASQIDTNKELIARELKERRQAKDLPLERAARRLGIRQAYLEALESGDYSALPEGVYSRNFLKEYALFLRLDPGPLLELYDLEAGAPDSAKQKRLFSHKVPRTLYFLTVPRIIRNLLSGLAVLVIFAYLGISVYRIITPPELVITQPAADMTIKENSITIIGYTEDEAEVMINEALILTDPDGFFTEEISLKTGLNTVTITARKKYSQENIEVRKILVNP